MGKTTERRAWWRFPSGTVYYGTASAVPGGSVEIDPPVGAVGGGVRVEDPEPPPTVPDDDEED